MKKSELIQIISALSEESTIEVVFETSWGHCYDAKITGVTLTVNDGTLGAKIKADEVVEEKAKEPVAEVQARVEDVQAKESVAEVQDSTTEEAAA